MQLPHTVTHQNKGFTLVELAIALMVIGLLIGGVLKGQELIENARITATIRQLKAYDAATMIFRNTYNALPGDIKRPNRIPNCTEELCSLGGNGNGKIMDTDTSPAYIEQFNFFPHLTKAGMIQGPEGGTLTELSATISDWSNEDGDLFFPSLPIDVRSFFRVNHRDGINSAYYIDTNSRIAQALDTKLDDGKPYTSAYETSGDVFPDAAGDCEQSDDPTEYNTQSEYCAIMLRAGF